MIIYIYIYETISTNQLFEYIHRKLKGGICIDGLNDYCDYEYPLNAIRYMKNGVEQVFSPKHPVYSLEYLLYDFLVDVLKNSPELISNFK